MNAPHPAPVILVTGAARRVGAEISRTLHAAGASVAVHCRQSTAEATQLVAELNARRTASAADFVTDLLDTDALPGLVAAVIDHFGRLDVLINNASSFHPTPMGTIDEKDWDDLIGSNLKAPLFLAQAAAPALALSSLSGGGCIINITDIHAERPLKGYPVYCAAKAGLLNLTRSLSVELGPQIRVNAVAPGAIQWPEDGDDFTPKERDAIIKHTLLKRIGHPTDIARTVKFLVFDAPYITGQVINVDGGRTAHL